MSGVMGSRGYPDDDNPCSLVPLYRAHQKVELIWPMWDVLQVPLDFSFLWDYPNHLEERLLDQARARALYNPLFGGRSFSILQDMGSDVQPFVKSSF